ncbi:MAG TPA: sigma-70 family RNA polymerase sigma factor [Thermoanaerobaculia bacterium]|nr:sigma-70 family RNA polymerase sigma factor [Thermoanaerobaculia bacterium]
MASGGRIRDDADKAEDGRLVHAAVAGEREAFGALYRRHARAVHGTLLSRLPPADADDGVQEVFLQAMKRLGELREPESFAAWVCAIARRRAVDHYRRRVEQEELPAEVPSRADTGARAEAGEVLRAIQQLPEAYHEPLVLRLVEGLSGPEIAAVTGLTPDSVRVNLHRGFRLLRQKLGVE